MAIPHFSVAIVGKSSGGNAVHAAAYAARADLTCEQTGRTYRYGRKSADLMASFVWIPKDAPEALRDRETLWNAVHQAAKRKDAQLARRIILALPHELTEKQREGLLKDYVRENFTRKGLAADVNIHRPDARGDDRNFHAHILIPTRTIDRNGIGRKHSDSDRREALQAWRDDWEKKVNYQLERYGHETRISMKSLAAQGIDRMPQIHLGQGASALDRKGISTERAEQLRAAVAHDIPGREPTTAVNLDFSIANDFPADVDTAQLRAETANDNRGAIGEELQTIDRDAQDAEWQDDVDRAGIEAAETQPPSIPARHAAERQDFEQRRRDMAARQRIAWDEVLERYRDSGAAYLDRTATQAAEAATGALSFFLSLFTSVAESVARSVTGGQAKARPRAVQKTREREQAERRRQQQQALEALMTQQAEEQAASERRREEMMRRQELQRGQFEEPEQKRWGALQTSFDRETAFREAMKAEGERKEAQQPAKDKGPQRGGPDRGLEL